MTVYNREKYLVTAIESVLVQTLTDFELLIVDDKSTDRSVEIAKSYAANDARIRVFINEQNLGDYPNRNHGASMSQGRYIKYVDSDDAILPNCLEMMVHMMERHPQAGMLLWSTEGDAFYPFVLSPLEVYRRYFFEGRRMERAPLSLLIRRHAFEEVGFSMCSGSSVRIRTYVSEWLVGTRCSTVRMAWYFIGYTGARSSRRLQTVAFGIARNTFALYWQRCVTGNARCRPTRKRGNWGALYMARFAWPASSLSCRDAFGRSRVFSHRSS
jgi:glycosyltransferase involved in cell wall biosynthesis